MLASSPPRRRRDAWILVGLIALAVGLPAIVGVVSGAITIPRNDDFAYRRAALMLYQHGRLEFTGWAVMTLVGQLAATMPLLWLTSGSAIAFALTTAGFAIVAIVASYSLARRVLSPGRAGLAVLARGPRPGVHALYDRLHDRGPGLRHGDVVPGDRGRGARPLT